MVAFLRRHPYSLVLILVVASIGVLGTAPDHGWPQVVVMALEGATLVSALHASRASRRRIEVVASLVGVMVVAAFIALVAVGQLDIAASRTAGAALVAIAPFAIARGVLRRIRVDRTITVDTVFGVLCVYLLIGMFFAFIYGLLDRVGTTDVFSQGDTGSDFLFFSYTTLTTVGYGNLTPATHVGETIAIYEMLMGQIYLVTIVSLIVGNVGRGRAQREA